MKDKELNIQKRIQLAMSEHGCLSFRNNSGATKTPTGGFVKYGVGNPGGSDLIGITPVTITPDMVGGTLGVFTAVEVKTPTGRATKEQLNFIAQVKAKGGIAGIARSVEDALGLLEGEE